MESSSQAEADARAGAVLDNESKSQFIEKAFVNMCVVSSKLSFKNYLLCSWVKLLDLMWNMGSTNCLQRKQQNLQASSSNWIHTPPFCHTPTVQLEEWFSNICLRSENGEFHEVENLPSHSCYFLDCMVSKVPTSWQSAARIVSGAHWWHTRQAQAIQNGKRSFATALFLLFFAVSPNPDSLFGYSFP